MTKIVHQTYQLESTLSKIALFAQRWKRQEPNTDPVLVLVHGLGEHSSRYSHLAATLGAELPFSAIYSYDQQGHGRSGGTRGHIGSFEFLRSDLAQILDFTLNEEKQKPVYLLGHSFGGLVALSWISSLSLTAKIKGVIFSAPLLGVTLKVPRYKKLLGKILGRSFSELQLTNEINPAFLSHDPKVVADYATDRLVHDKVTPKLYLEMNNEMKRIESWNGPMPCPSLFLVPREDKLVDSEKTVSFFNSLKSREKKLIEYPHFYHEILNELEHTKVFQDLSEWILEVEK